MSSIGLQRKEPKKLKSVGSAATMPLRDTQDAPPMHHAFGFRSQLLSHYVPPPPPTPHTHSFECDVLCGILPIGQPGGSATCSPQRPELCSLESRVSRLTDVPLLPIDCFGLQASGDAVGALLEECESEHGKELTRLHNILPTIIHTSSLQICAMQRETPA